MKWVKAAALACAICGMSGRADAGSITLSVDLNGQIIFTATSTSPDQSVSASLSGVNSALTAHGSAYQFTSLVANSDYTGGGTYSFLEVLAALNTSGAGSTADLLSIDVTQTDFVSPTGNLTAAGSDYGTFDGVNGTASFTGDVNGSNLSTLTNMYTGADGMYSGTTGSLSVGTVGTGYELSAHYLIGLDKDAGTSLSVEGKTTLGSPPTVPEPSSMALCAIAGMVGLGVGKARRKRTAVA